MRKMIGVLCIVVSLIAIISSNAFAVEDQSFKFLNLCRKGTEEDFNRIMKKVGPNTILDNDGNTAVLLAAKHNMFGIVRRLVDMGGDVHRVNNFHISTLAYAAACRNTKLVKYLLEKGVDIGCRDSQNNDPILRQMFTIEVSEYLNQTCNLPNGNVDDYGTFKALIDAGASVLDANKNGENMLHYAVREGKNATIYFYDMLYELDPAGCNDALTMKNKKGLSPLDLTRGESWFPEHIRDYLNNKAGLTKLNPYE